MEELLNVKCEMCELNSCISEERETNHNIRSGFIHCSICGQVYHPKYPTCGHVKPRVRIVDFDHRDWKDLNALDRYNDICEILSDGQDVLIKSKVKQK